MVVYNRTPHFLAADFLKSQGLSADRIEHVVQIINHISFNIRKKNFYLIVTVNN